MVSRRTLLALPLLLAARRAFAFGEQARFTFAQVRHGGRWDPRPDGLSRLSWEISKRTSIETSPAVKALGLADPDLFRYPFVVLSSDQAMPAPADTARGAPRPRRQRGGGAAALPQLRRLPPRRRRQRHARRAVRAVGAPTGLAHRSRWPPLARAARSRALQVVLPAGRSGGAGGRHARSGGAGAGRPPGGALFGQRHDRRARPRFSGELGVRGDPGRRAPAREVHPAGREHRHVLPVPRLQGGSGPHPLHHEAQEDLIPESAYNAWRITSLSTLPAWVLALAMAGLLAAVWLSFRGFRSEPAGIRRVALLGFRVLAALLVLALLLEPGLELRSESRVRARIALL